MSIVQYNKIYDLSEMPLNHNNLQSLFVSGEAFSRVDGNQVVAGSNPVRPYIKLGM